MKRRLILPIKLATCYWTVGLENLTGPTIGAGPGTRAPNRPVERERHNEETCYWKEVAIRKMQSPKKLALKKLAIGKR